MSIDLGIPWERYALITELSSRLARRGQGLFGKTALQKYVYLLQTLYGVDCAYDFPLYTYGPFSSDLLGDLDSVEGLGGVTVSYLPTVGGYQIEPGRSAAAVKSRAKPFLADASSSIDRLLQEFGAFSAKELELRATIVYAERDDRRHKEETRESSLVKTVHRIKPHFSPPVIRDAVRELAASGHITVH